MEIKDLTLYGRMVYGLHCFVRYWNMLDTEENRDDKRIHKIYGECFERAKTFRKNTGSSLEKTPLKDYFKPVSEEYERITGFKDFPHNAVMHHRISIYGQPCKCCGKPLRTPRAKMCAACGAKVMETQK